jgi:hypothetical protein
MSPPAILKWIRFPEQTSNVHRFHAAMGFDYGGYWTACGRFIRSTGVTDIADAEPTLCCACCRVRLRLPYLLPKSVLEALKPAKARLVAVPVVLSDDDLRNGVL